MVNTILRICVGIIVCSATLSTWGNNKLTPYTKVFMQMQKQRKLNTNGMVTAPNAAPAATDSNHYNRIFTKMSRVDGVDMVNGFITVDDDIDIADIESLGVDIKSQIGKILLVSMPVESLDQIAEINAVSKIDIARPVKLLNDSVRSITHVNLLHEGQGLEQPYTGAGVIVGVVDQGIDFNHINFTDADGNSRIVAAYCDGTTYYDATEISGLTTDIAETHGTHVAGTAAGSYTNNNYHGMAPDADLYLCGMGNSLTTYDIAVQAQNIMQYAEQQGKPAVVNFSLGYNIGSHMGSSFISQVTDQLAGEGKIFVFAAGNEGDVDLYLNKVFENETGEEQVKTILNRSYYSYDEFASYSTYPVSVKFSILDENNSIVAETDTIALDAEGGSWTLSLSDSSSTFDTYCSGDIEVQGLYEEATGKYEMYCYITLSTRWRYDDHSIAITFYGTQGDEIDVYSDAYLTFGNNGSNDYTAGSPDGSISEMATGVNAISVGASASKVRYTSYSGNTFSFDSSLEVNNMAYFSSYGYDGNDVWHPIIIAPGATVVSSYSRYNSYSSSSIVDQVTSGGSTYRWGTSMGTSMATPAVTGIIATWLQYDPTLTPDEIKSIFAATAQKVEKFGTGNELQWGPNGIIDAYAGMSHLITTGVNDVTKKQDQVLVYPNPCNGEFSILAQGENEVNVAIYSTSGNLVYRHTYATNNGSFNVDLQNSLPKGIYLLQVRGNRIDHTSKLIIK